MGVLSPLVGVIGSLQATEALKLLSGMRQATQGQLLMFNAMHTEWQSIQTPRLASCPVCSSLRPASDSMMAA